MPETGWTCPRCSRVYAPTTPECRACNEAITVGRKAGILPGINVLEDGAVPQGEVHFRSKKGELLGKITGLPYPKPVKPIE